MYICQAGDSEKLAQLVREIGWSHNITILERCKSDEEREFYIRNCRRYGWTRSVLVHQIENQGFQRTLNSQANFDAMLPDTIKIQAKLAVKDEYLSPFSTSKTPIAKENWIVLSLGGSRLSCGRWGICSPLWAANIGFSSVSVNSSSISCSIIGGCERWWRWN